MLPTTTDVLVIGAGPTGLTVAVSLAGRGLDVTVIDAQRPATTPRGLPSSMPGRWRSLEDLGVSERLTALGIHAPRFTVKDRDRTLVPVGFGELGPDTPTRCWSPRR